MRLIVLALLQCLALTGALALMRPPLPLRTSSRWLGFSSASSFSSSSFPSSVANTRTSITSLNSAVTNILTPAEFEEATKGAASAEGLPSVIDFQKSKCKPCIRVAPEYEALAEKYKGTARFFKVDADSSAEALALMKANGIRSVPTFQVWKGGELVDSIQGAHLDELEESLVSTKAT